MKRVAIVMPVGNQRGGAEAMLMHLLRENAAMPKLDCPLFFLSDGPLVDEMRGLGYAVTVFPPPGRLREVHRYVSTVLQLRRAFRQADVDSVLSWTANGHLYAGPAALSLGIPVFWFLHRIPGSDRMTRIYNTIPTTGIFACSQAAASAQTSVAPHRLVTVCHPAVDLAHLERTRQMGQAYWRSRLGLPVQVPIVGMVARMERWKGVDVFIKVVAQLAYRHADLHAFVVGGAHPSDLDYARELYALAEETGLGDRLRLVGQIPLEEVAGWWAACDVAIHPVTGAEPFGMGIVEAMAMEKPVIASAIGGPAEIIQDQVNGLLCAPGDVEELVRAAEDLLSDPAHMQSMGRAACVRAQDFSPQRLLQCLATHLSGEEWEAAR
jgi:glycosyltransferase involved in cell wall biosynthesis